MFLAAAPGAFDWDQLRQLGLPTLALIVGAVGTYRFGVLPARADKDAERKERIESQAREREAYQVTTPALIQANANHANVLELLRRRRDS